MVKRCKMQLKEVKAPEPEKGPFVHNSLPNLDLGWYAQRRCTFTLERNADFGRRAMLLNAENSGIPAAT